MSFDHDHKNDLGLFKQHLGQVQYEHVLQTRSRAVAQDLVNRLNPGISKLIIEYTQFYHVFETSALACVPTPSFHANFRENGLNSELFPSNICKIYFQDEYSIADAIYSAFSRIFTTAIYELTNKVIVLFSKVDRRNASHEQWKESETIKLYSNLNDLFEIHPDIIEKFDKYQFNL